MPEMKLTKDEIQAIGYAVHWLSLRLRNPIAGRDEGEDKMVNNLRLNGLKKLA